MVKNLARFFSLKYLEILTEPLDKATRLLYFIQYMNINLLCPKNSRIEKPSHTDFHEKSFPWSEGHAQKIFSSWYTSKVLRQIERSEREKIGGSLLLSTFLLITFPLEIAVRVVVFYAIWTNDAEDNMIR